MILEPKKVSQNILDQAKEEAHKLREDGIMPKLAILRIGNDIGSVSYEKSILNLLEPLGIEVEPFVFKETITQEEFLEELEQLNNNKEVDSILIFKPLPDHFDELKISESINPQKDADALNPINMGKLFMDDPTGFIPCTAEAIVELLDFYGIDVKGKDITIINNSDTIGKPLSILLTNRFATITLCHIYTKDLVKQTKDADIVITAVGKYGLVTPEMLSDKATLIDAAITIKKDKNSQPVLDENNKKIRTGDALESCKDKVENIISASPGCGGGTGSITTALLAKHIIKAAQNRKG